MGKVAAPGWPSRTPEIPKDKNFVALDDPRYPIFKQLYMVRIPSAQLRTVQDLRNFGTVQTGIKEYDDQMAREEKVVMLPISELVRLYKEGAKIAVVNDADTRKIYEAASIYLTFWKNRLTGNGMGASLNQATFPAQDLLDLDEFAHTVYERAKWHFEADYVSQHMSVLRRSGARGVLSALKIREDKPVERVVPGINFREPPKAREKLAPVELVDNPPEEESDHPKRDSLADFFKPNKHTSGNLTIHGIAQAPAPRTASVTPSIQRLLGNKKGPG